MKVVRPASLADLPRLVELVAGAGASLTSLPPDRERLAARIAASEASFAGRSERADETYLFVLEDLPTGRLTGTCGIDAAVGLRQAWVSYRVGLAVHASQELGVFTQTPTLFLSNDHTGQSELCSLLLHPEFRQGGLGALLSKSRFLFMAEHRERFAAKVIAELRGVMDALGHSPFWEGLGRHFFSMDFSRAHYLTGIGRKSFVAELMPKYPLYTKLLSAEAQAVIGQTHADTVPARRLLEQEGLRYEGLVDIFDAGPVIECAVEDVSAIRRSPPARDARGAPGGRDPLARLEHRIRRFPRVAGRGRPRGRDRVRPA